jgi:hypothetical protein
MTSPPPLPSWVSGNDFNAPIFVTGLPRSGTSLVAGLLATCGLWLGRTPPGDAQNIRGYFENIVLREKVQKEILRRGRYDPLGVQTLPPRGWLPGIPDFRALVAAALVIQNYDGRQLWGFKEPKMCLMWRLWDQHFPGARWVFVRRPLEQVVGSCMRTSFLRHQSSDPKFWQRFAEAYLERLADLQSSVGSCRVIDSSDIVAGRLQSIEGLVTELRLVWRPEEVRAFIAPEYWHSSSIEQA